MHNSTLCKTGFYRAIDKLAQGKLKTNAKGMGGLLIGFLKAGWLTVALASALISVPISVYQGFIWLTT